MHILSPEEITVPMVVAAFPFCTPRECEVLLWVMNGKTDPVIAIILGMRRSTASTHVRNLLGKLRVETRVSAAIEVVNVVICRLPPVGG